MRVLTIMAVMLTAGPAAAQEVAGSWRTEAADNGAYLEVRIGPCGYDTSKTCGVIEKASGTDRADLLGRPIITGMTPAGAGRWRGGQIWAPDDDKTYRSNMELVGEQLQVEGCVAIFCRGQTWTRVK